MARSNVVSKFWYTADCGPHVAQITGKLWQWLSGSTPRPKRAANGLLAVPWCRELTNAVPDQQLVQGLFRNTFWPRWANLGVPDHFLGSFCVFRNNFTGTRQILLTTLKVNYHHGIPRFLNWQFWGDVGDLVGTMRHVCLHCPNGAGELASDQSNHSRFFFWQ